MSTVCEMPQQVYPQGEEPQSFSNEGLRVRAIQNRIARNYYESCSRQEDLPYKFMKLANIWKKDTAHMSSIQLISMHPAYQQIIGMGPVVIPYILRQLLLDRGFWFWALKSITGENPIKSEHRGNVDRMIEDWIKWGIDKNIV